MLLSWLTVAHAATLSVGPGQTYTTISSAVSDAAPNDVIEVAPGTYPERLQLGSKRLTIVGTGGSGSTTVGPAPSGDAVLFLSNGYSATQAIELRGFTLDAGNQRRVALMFSPVFTGHDLVFVNGKDIGPLPPGGASLAAVGGTIELSSCSFEDPTTTLDDGAHANLAGTTATFTDCAFANGSAADQGGAVYLASATATFVRTTFDGNHADTGGALSGELWPGGVALEDCTLTGNTANNYGAGLTFGGGDLVIRGTTFESNTAGWDAAAIDVGGQYTLLVEDSTFRGNESGIGAVGTFGVGDVTIRRSWFEANHGTDDGGAVWLGSGTAAATIEGNVFCANQADDDGGALYFDGEYGMTASVRNNVFVDNSAFDDGGAAYFRSAAAAIEYNTWLDNRSVGSFGTLFIGSNTGALIRGNAMAYSTGVGVFRAYGPIIQESYNLFWNNNGGDANFSLDATDLLTPPLFVDYVRDDCTSDMRPAPMSPLIDAGPPSELDDDGTRADIGAYGGPGAVALVDVDGDGQIDGDCEPFDGQVFPSAIEIPADGIDQDCDGLELCYLDGDGDGVGSDALTAGSLGCDGTGEAGIGGDCDDSDGSVQTGCAQHTGDTGPAADTGDTGLGTTTDTGALDTDLIDTGAPAEDTDPNRSPPIGEELPPTWFCATGPTRRGLWLWLLALVSARRAGRRSS